MVLAAQTECVLCEVGTEYTLYRSIPASFLTEIDVFLFLIVVSSVFRFFFTAGKEPVEWTPCGALGTVVLGEVKENAKTRS